MFPGTAGGAGRFSQVCVDSGEMMVMVVLVYVVLVCCGTYD